MAGSSPTAAAPARGSSRASSTAAGSDSSPMSAKAAAPSRAGSSATASSRFSRAPAPPDGRRCGRDRRAPMWLVLFGLALTFAVMLLFGGMEFDRGLLLLLYAGEHPQSA